MIRAVAFDFGHVLASGETIFTDPARLLGVDPAAIEALYWQGRVAYDEGASEGAYWGPILAALGKPTTPELVQTLARLDAAAWTPMRPAARRLLAEVRAAGRLVAIVSNAPFAMDTAFFEADYADEADYWFVSASMGVAKPQRAVYDRVTEVLELEPAEIAFIDDRPANIAGADAFGWTTHLWLSDADTRAWLVEVGVLA